MSLKNTSVAFVLAFLFCSFSSVSSIKESIEIGQYNNYNQSWSYPTLADGFTGGGGGSLTVSIVDNLLTVNFNAGFSQNKLKIGNVVYLATSPAIPDMELGFLNLKNGTTIYNSSVKVSIISNYIYFQHMAGHNSQLYTSIIGSFQVDLSSMGSGGSSSSTLSKDQNYVYTVTAQDGTSDLSNLSEDKKMESVTYFDGLGRPVQQIGIRQAGGDGYEDIVTHISYDEFGRQSKSFLPYPDVGNTGSYRTDDVLLKTQNHYLSNYASDFPGLSAANTNPFSETLYEASPLNRPLKQAAPGAAWKLGGGHEIEYDYQTNVLNEVRLYDVSLAFANGIYEPTLILNSYYSPGELYKTTTYDENNNSKAKAHSVEEFKDKQGNLILKRTYVGTTSHDTYYVYDDFGNLTFVLPPKSEPQSAKPDATELSELCYQYKYDGENRLVEKKIPGKGWEYIVYNKLDQPVLTQDEVQRNKNPKEWLFTKYDAFGRVTYTGYISSGSTRLQYQTAVDADADQYEKRGSATSFGGTSVYYSKNAQPDAATEIYTINYYDDYNVNTGFTIPASNSFGEPIVGGTATKGLPTVSKVKVLGTSSWITTAFGYDDKGRVIWTKTTNPYLGVTETVENKLDFTGNIEETKTNHQKTGKADILLRDYFTYDHVKRLKMHTQSINGGALEVIADNTYDKLGQLVSKGVGNTDGQTRLQEIDYTYNVRGWLKTINDVTTTNKLFNFKIAYNDPSLGTPLYNGNISRVDWRTKNTDNSLKYYRYYYDNLNRLTSATASSSNYNVSGITYDKNGNILSLTRRGAINSGATSFGEMDKLIYSYQSYSNKLLKVADGAAVDSYGFKDDALNTAADTYNDYAYDPNGNLTSDANKGITAITYNHLNLPKSVSIGGGTITYIYDATGVKQRKVAGTTTTDYAGNFLYKNNSLQFFSHPEGYVENVSGAFKYHYQYKDHLGNIRLSYFNNGTAASPSAIISEENNYYPFGLRHKGYNDAPNGYGNSAAKMFKFGGKELQDETIGGKNLDWYDFHARNYDAALGRWMNLDPLAENYLDQSPYVFVANNPMVFTDPDGMRIDISQAQQYDKDNDTNYVQQIINDLQSQTGLTFNITDDGFLEFEKNEDGIAVISKDENGNEIGSSLARGAIMRGINHEDTGTFKLTQSGGSQGQGLDFNLDVNEIDGFINGTSSELNSKTMGFGMMFTHELLHTNIGMSKLHGDEVSSWGKTGTIVNVMNSIRGQLGADYGQRRSYLSFTEGGKSHLPFDAQNKTHIYNRIRLIQNTPPGVWKPGYLFSRTGQYIRY